MTLHRNLIVAIVLRNVFSILVKTIIILDAISTERVRMYTLNFVNQIGSQDYGAGSLLTQQNLLVFEWFQVRYSVLVTGSPAYIFHLPVIPGAQSFQ